MAHVINYNELENKERRGSREVEQKDTHAKWNKKMRYKISTRTL